MTSYQKRAEPNRFLGCVNDTISEYEAIVVLAAAFIVVYIVGTFRNRRLLVKYSQITKKHLGPSSEFLGFRPFGSSGFRALCNIRSEKPLSKMEVAVSLVDRENVMHYPLSWITKEKDKVTVWAYPRKRPVFSLGIWSTKEKNLRPQSELELKEIKTDQENLGTFRILSSDDTKADEFLSDKNLLSSLPRAKDFLHSLLVDKNESRIILTGRLTDDSLPALLDLVMASASRAS